MAVDPEVDHRVSAAIEAKERETLGFSVSDVGAP